SNGRPAHSRYNLRGLAGDAQRTEDGVFGGLVCECATAEMPTSNISARRTSFMPHYEHLMRVFLVPNSINTDRMIGLGFRCLGIVFQARDFSFACHVSDFAVQIPVAELL